MPPYLIFIIVSKSTHPVNMVVSSQNAQYFHLSARPKISMARPLFISSLIAITVNSKESKRPQKSRSGIRNQLTTVQMPLQF
jgi:hypothetical protein